MNMVTKLQTILTPLSPKLKPIASHLQGLTPASLSTDQLLQPLVDDNNLTLALQWLCTQTNVGRYLLRWLGWVLVAVPMAAGAGNGPCTMATMIGSTSILAFASGPTNWHGGGCTTMNVGGLTHTCDITGKGLGAFFYLRNASQATSKSGCDFNCNNTSCSVYGGSSMGLPVELLEFNVE